MREIITLTGCSASGKDTVLRKVIESNSNIVPIISSTTRPMRVGEENGREYNFIDNKDLDLNKFIEYREYNTINGVWIYGVGEEEFYKKLNMGTPIIILDYEGLKKIRKYCFDHEISVTSYYIDVSLRERLKRSLDREKTLSDKDCLEICRRAIDDYNNVLPCKKDKDVIVLNSLSSSNNANIILRNNGVTLSKKEYDDLLKDSSFLYALKCNGLEDWIGYKEIAEDFCNR